MKAKTLLLAVAVGVCFGAAVMFALMGGMTQVKAACPGAAGTPCGNGDVNGSGGMDIADAVYLLSYMFGSGPAPAAIECPECPPCDSCCPEPPACDSCCPPCPPPSLPATGQTKCYNTDGNVIDCASAAWPGQDGFYQKGCPTAGRFVDNGDGTVTDNCTGLMWQKDTADKDGNGMINNNDITTWQEALQYCENLDFAGYHDWRLPNIRELQSIPDYGRVDPSIDPVFGALAEWYWSSSSLLDMPYYAWGVFFHGGGAYGGYKEDYYYVRAVRDAR
jgi:hypothetical protein